MTADPPPSGRPGTVSDLMSRDVVTISPDASVRALARLLKERGISGVPVVDADGDAVGTASITDILWLSDRILPLLAQKQKPTGQPSSEEATEQGAPGEGVPEDGAEPGLGLVRDIMTADVFALPPTATLEELLEFVSRTGLRRVPIVEERKVVGIVTATDLLGLLV